jgi:hypothetical protein
MNSDDNATRQANSAVVPNNLDPAEPSTLRTMKKDLLNYGT